MSSDQLTLVICCMQGMKTTQLYRDYFISHCKGPHETITISWNVEGFWTLLKWFAIQNRQQETHSKWSQQKWFKFTRKIDSLSIPRCPLKIELRDMVFENQFDSNLDLQTIAPFVGRHMLCQVEHGTCQTGSSWTTWLDNYPRGMASTTRASMSVATTTLGRARALQAQQIWWHSSESRCTSCRSPAGAEQTGRCVCQWNPVQKCLLVEERKMGLTKNVGRTLKPHGTDKKCREDSITSRVQEKEAMKKKPSSKLT